MNTKRGTPTYDVGNPGPDFGYAQICNRLIRFQPTPLDTGLPITNWLPAVFYK